MSGLYEMATRAMRLIDPEAAHGLAISALKAGLGPRSSIHDDPSLSTKVGGLALANPVGLAPGFDKNAEVPAAMFAAGFGFVECGTVTPLPQAGNPRPRLFRLTEDRAVINRMGFNGAGLDAFVERLAARRSGGVVGANIGANKDTADRPADYIRCLERLWGLCDYFTLNISSPNTPGLRTLQTKGALQDLLGRVAEARGRLAAAHDYPVFLKVAPDLDDVEVIEIVEAGVRFGLQAIVVGNTTLTRPPGLRSPLRSEAGGLSGAPLLGPSTAVLRRFYDASAGRIDLIGVGGIASGADAYGKVRAGAKAVQLYSALVFGGPGLAIRIRRELAGLLRADGFASIGEAVGAR